MHEDRPDREAPERNNALCCECGTGRRYSPKGYAGAGDPVACGERGGPEPLWRSLRTLRCQTCKARTRHALIRDDEYRDDAEEKDRACDLDRRELGARLFRLELTGVVVRWSAADTWPARTVIELVQFRSPCEESLWLVLLSERAEPDSLLRCLADVERTIDRQGFSHDWAQNDAEDYEWRGERFVS